MLRKNVSLKWSLKERIKKINIIVKVNFKIAFAY